MHIPRWQIRRDYTACSEIAAALHDWDESDILDHNRQRNGIASVVEIDDRIVGWVAYTLHESHVYVHNIASINWRQDVFESLIQRLINRAAVSESRRDMIVIAVPDRCDDALVMLRGCGFLVVGQIDGMIQMRYTIPISTELVEIDGITCRRVSGFPVMLPRDTRK